MRNPSTLTIPCCGDRDLPVAPYKEPTDTAPSVLNTTLVCSQIRFVSGRAPTSVQIIPPVVGGESPFAFSSLLLALTGWATTFLIVSLLSLENLINWSTLYSQGKGKGRGNLPQS